MTTGTPRAAAPCEEQKEINRLVGKAEAASPDAQFLSGSAGVHVKGGFSIDACGIAPPEGKCLAIALRQSIKEIDKWISARHPSLTVPNGTGKTK